MKRGVTLRKEAEKDLEEAFHYYQTCQPGLGREYLQCVEEALAEIERHPQAFRCLYKNVRRAFMHRFPYGIYYLAESGQIVILAVMHARRNPTRWQGRS